MWLAELSVRRPVFAIMLMTALVTLGILSLDRLGVDLFPKVEFPYITVTTLLEGASPATVETEISDVVEEHLNTISAIEAIRSSSSEGVSQVFIEFELEEDVNIKAQEVRDRAFQAVRGLPKDAEPPVVGKIDPDAEPIMHILISGDLPIRELTAFADYQIKERLERVKGVGSIFVIGGRKREVRIWPDNDRLRSYGVTGDEVIRAIRREHAEIPGGRMDTAGMRAEFGVKTKGEVMSVAEFGDIVVAFRDGTPTRLRDLARVEDGLEDQRTYAELNGTMGVSLAIRRQSGTNVVEINRAIRTAVANLQDHVPPGVKMVIVRDTGQYIESQARDVAFDMILGIVLVVIVTLFFLLSIRATLIVAIAMPVSLISTFFCFYLLDFTINVVTLMALSIAIGILIDDATVVLESIHRYIEEGHPPMEATLMGVKRVVWAVIAGTTSVMAVFTPIAFTTGVIGEFFYQYALAVVFAVGTSLLVSLTLTPALCARFLKPAESTGPVARKSQAIYAALEGFYFRVLGTVLRHRGLVMLFAAAAVGGGVMVSATIPLAFVPSSDKSEFLATLELPLGTGIEVTRSVANRVTTDLRRNKYVTNVFFTVGDGVEGRVNEAHFHVALVAKQDRDTGQTEIMQMVRETMISAAPEATRATANEIPSVSGGGFSAFTLEYVLTGPSLEVMDRLAGQIMSRARATGLFTDLKSSYETGKPEVQLHVDRQRAADLGVSVLDLATAVRSLVGGRDIASYEEDGRRYDVRVRLEEHQRNDPERLGTIQVRAADGRLVDLASVGEFRVELGPVRIDRYDRARKISIYANLPMGVALGTATQTFDNIVSEVSLPADYAGQWQGNSKMMREAAETISFAFALALVSLYMILASQFNSFVQPAITMLTAPLSFIGAFALLAYSGMAMSIFAQIGLIALMGLVMKNGILLIDYANQMRAEGMSAREAMLKAGPIRLRPVLMTAVSTIFAMIPMAISTSDGTEWRNPMGILIIGGLASSTLLTLLVIPVSYSLVDDAQTWAARLLGGGRTSVADSRGGEAGE